MTVENNKPMSLEQQVSVLAEALCAVIAETPDEDFKNDPKEVYVDLACRLVIRLAGKLTIVPAGELKQTCDADAAAARSLKIIDEWLKTKQRRQAHIETEIDGTIGLRLFDAAAFDYNPLYTDYRPFFTYYHRGESLQDAFGQAATTIALTVP
jgi:hypothetical protein